MESSDNSRVFQSYYYPESDVYVNKLGILDAELLKKYEADKVALKIMSLEKSPLAGDHSLSHWQRIHAFMFGDVYQWAGSLREIHVFAEYNSPFASPEKIALGFTTIVETTLAKNDHLKSSNSDTIVNDISMLMGELYYIHPFRDGNTRSLIQFTREIARDAGWRIDFSSFREENWNRLQDGIVQAALERNTQLLEETLSECMIYEAKAHDIQINKQYLVESAVAIYDDSVKMYLHEKQSQTEHIETVLESRIGNQRELVRQTAANRPGPIASLWKGAAWKQEQQTRQARLETLECRLSRVKKLRQDGKRLEDFAIKKLRRNEPELTAKRDELLQKQRREAVAAQVKRQEQAREQGQSLGLSRIREIEL